MRLQRLADALRVHAWWLYLAVMTPLAALYLVGPSSFGGGPVFNGIGLSAVVAIVAGVRMHRPTKRLSWLLFALGQLLFVSGDVLAYNYPRLFGHELPFPSIADAFYIAVFPAIVAGILLLIRQRGDGHDWGSLIDSLIITTGAGLLSWLFLMSPYARDGSLAPSMKLTFIAYPLMDLLVLAVAVRLAVGRGVRSASYWLMIASICALFTTDTVYGWIQLHGGYSPGALLDGGWIVFYLLWGAAALHPSMAASPTSGRPLRLTHRRLLVLAAATFVAPVMTISGRATQSDRFVVGGAAIALFSLVLLRMVGLMKAQEAASLRAHALDGERAQNKRLRELDQLKDQFIATVSHELRTPLTSIHGYLDLVLGGESGELADEQRQFLSIVARNSDRLRRLVNDLLVVSQADAGLALDLSDVDLRAIAQDSVESARPQAEAAAISLGLTAPPAFPLTGDPGRLSQLLDNLISNALKFTPAGGRVSVRVTRSGDVALLEVEDTGMGIPADEQEFLFDRFFRAHAAGEQAIQGTGLGLSIAQEIAQAHGGRIGFTSREAVGTTFRVELPLAATAPERVPVLVGAA
jgi:signal transduction histidine kinase